MKNPINRRIAKLVRQSVAKANAAFYCNSDHIFEARPQEIVEPNTVERTVHSVLAEATGYDGTVD
jgi:hypothetical protein